MQLSEKNRRPSFSTTPFGLSCIIASITFLVAGITRGELGAMLCGSAFLIYSLFAFLSAFISSMHWRRISPVLAWKSTGLCTVSIPEKDQNKLAFWLILSDLSYRTYFSVQSKDKKERPFCLEVSVDGAETEKNVPLPSRGIYTATCHYLDVCDHTRFFSIRFPLPAENRPDTFVVAPIPQPSGESSLVRTISGITRGKSTFRRSDELYEARPYHPGDDPRKINWKIYAHNGTLALREGELLPPPSSEYFIVIQSGNVRKTRDTERCFNLLIDRIAYLALDLLARNKKVTVVTSRGSGKADFKPIQPQASGCREILLETLAGPQPDLDQESILFAIETIPAGSAILYFCLPDPVPANFSRFPKSARFRLYTGPRFSDEPEQSFRNRISGLLFMPPDQAADPEPPGFRIRREQYCTDARKAGFHVTEL